MSNTPKNYDNAAQYASVAPGIGPVALGQAVPGFQSFAAAGAADQDVVSYSIRDVNDQWEIGQGLYGSAGPTLTRTQIYKSSNATSSTGPINASANCVIFITVTAYDIKTGKIPAGGTTGQVLTKNSSSDYDVSWKTP